MTSDAGLRELIVCSLERWDQIWRRNQFLVHHLLDRHPALRVLFVEPPADPLFDLSTRRVPSLPRLRSISHDARLRAFRPLKLVPRRFGDASDRLLYGQLRAAVRLVAFSQPVLWLNDTTYVPFVEKGRWPTVYDITDDWLRAPFPTREIQRLMNLESLAMERADEVVVCSTDLAQSRGAVRPVHLIPNGVDVEHFTRPRPRPNDMPAAPVAVYVGTLHESRLDIELAAELAKRLADLSVVLVGPNSLTPESTQRLASAGKVHLLGARPYTDVPAYLQHADVIVVPHVVSPFTESLDPIKAYECLAVDTPTVATPVAGFRERAADIMIAEGDEFVSLVSDAIGAPRGRHRSLEIPSWEQRTREFEDVLARARDAYRSPVSSDR